MDAVFAIGQAFTQIKDNCTGLTDATGIQFCNRTNITSTELQIVIQTDVWYGSTGLIDFDGSNRANLTFEVRQRASSGALTIVGYYNGTNVTYDNSLLIWKNGEKPVSMIVPQQVNIDSPIGIVFLVLTIIALIISICFSFLFWHYKDEKVVKKTSPFFSQLILIGVDLCLISQIFWGVSQSSFTCFIKIWLLAIGFGLIMGNLLAKTYRIFKIFTNVQITNLILKDTDLLKFSVVILSIEVALLCVYCFVSGTPRPVNIQSTSDSLLLIIQCAVPSSFVQLFGQISILTFNGLLILCGVVIAYVSRNVESSFNESKYIAITVYIYLLVIIILLPLYYTAGDSGSSVNRQYILRNISVLAAMYFTLVALFVPKIMNIYRTKKEEERKRRRADHTTDSTTGGRIRSQIGVSASRASQTEGDDSLFSRMLISQGSQGGTAGGSVSFGGAGGTVGSITSDEAQRSSYNRDSGASYNRDSGASNNNRDSTMSNATTRQRASEFRF